MRKCKYELCSLSHVGPILQNTRNRNKIWGNSSKSHKHLVGFGCNSASAILSKTFCPYARARHLLSRPLIDYSGKSIAIAVCVGNLCNGLVNEKAGKAHAGKRLSALTFQSLRKKFWFEFSYRTIPVIEVFMTSFFWVLTSPRPSCCHVANSAVFQGHSVLHKIITFYEEQILLSFGSNQQCRHGNL